MYIKLSAKKHYVILIQEANDSKAYKAIFSYMKNTLTTSVNENQLELAKLNLERYVKILYLHYSNSYHNNTMREHDAFYLDFLLQCIPYVAPDLTDGTLVKQVRDTLILYKAALPQAINNNSTNTEQLKSPENRMSWESYLLACNKYMKKRLAVMKSQISLMEAHNQHRLDIFERAVENQVEADQLSSTEETQLLQKFSINEDEQQAPPTECCNVFKRYLCCYK